MAFRTAVAAAGAALISAAPAADKVASLPGWGAPPSATYSGYLSAANGTKHLHYMLFSSFNDPKNDPTVFWFNGGPGCSSLEGAFEESGPLWSANGGATLQVNNYTWAAFSNHVFLESPACVGFSYADSPNGCAASDTSAAKDNLDAVIDFYTLFPELAANDLYITGESYAGIYIPMLAYNIVQYNAAKPAVSIPLRGIAVGNGCLGNSVGICGNGHYGDYLLFLQLYGHGFIRQAEWNNILKLCGDFSTESPACQDALNTAGNAVGNIDVYFLYDGTWQQCEYAERNMTRIPRRPIRPGSVQSKMLQGNSCTNDNDLTTYLNRADVQAALHVKPTSFQGCSDIPYTSDMVDERTTIYPGLVDAKIRILIYNGEADACVPITDNQWWTESMGYKVKSPWTAWTVGNTIGGYQVLYEPTSGSEFRFASVRGSGHLVPQTQPPAALQMARNFILNQPWN